MNFLSKLLTQTFCLANRPTRTRPRIFSANIMPTEWTLDANIQHAQDAAMEGENINFVCWAAFFKQHFPLR